KAPATWVGFVPGHEFLLDLIDLRLQLRIFLGVSREELSSQAGEAFIGLNASEQGSEVSNPLGGGQTELCRIASDRIGELGAIRNQPIAQAKQHQSRLPLGCLYRPEPHRRWAHRLAKRFRVCRIVLAPFDIWLDQLRRDQLY